MRAAKSLLSRCGLSLAGTPPTTNTSVAPVTMARSPTTLPNRPQNRATASAVLLFLINLIGLGLGPLGVGAVSDLISGPLGLGMAEGVRWSLMIFILFGALASTLFWMARKTIREEMVS